jgi:hypothetical protein
LLLLAYFRDFPEEIPLNAVAFCGMVHRARGQKGKKKGGGSRFSDHETFSSAALLFPTLPPGGAHHSAANEVSERNLHHFFNRVFEIYVLLPS